MGITHEAVTVCRSTIMISNARRNHFSKLLRSHSNLNDRSLGMGLRVNGKEVLLRLGVRFQDSVAEMRVVRYRQRIEMSRRELYSHMKSSTVRWSLSQSSDHVCGVVTREIKLWGHRVVRCQLASFQRRWFNSRTSQYRPISYERNN